MVVHSWFYLFNIVFLDIIMPLIESMYVYNSWETPHINAIIAL